MVEYIYDSWGKIIAATSSLTTGLKDYQPFRYRGYVYDTETQWYYLQSRYYDPSTCRFISADVYLSTDQGVIGHNTFAYCGNNPILREDCSGEWWGESAWEWVKGAAKDVANWTKKAASDVYNAGAKAYNNAKSWVQNATNTATKLISNTAKKIGGWVKKAYNSAKNWVKKAVNDAWKWIKKAATKTCGWIKKAANAVWNWLY